MAGRRTLAARLHRCAVMALVVGSVLVATVPATRPAFAAGAPAAPDAPTGVPGDGSVALSWSAPADNGSPITEYRVYGFVNADTHPFAITVAAPATSLIVGDLTNGDAHAFQVSAVNANGESAPSESSATYVPVGTTTTAITFSPPTATYGTSVDVIVTVTGSSTVNEGTVSLYRNGALVGTLGMETGSVQWTIANLPGGSTTFRADFSGLPAWWSSTSSQSVTIAKATQTITFAQPADTAYATHSFSVAPTASSFATVSLSSGTPTVCTVSGFTVTLVSGGTCTLVAERASTTNHLAATSVSRSFQVTSAPQTITFADPADRTWSATAFDLAPTASSGLAVTLTSDTPEVCEVDTMTVTMVQVGTCTLTASQAGTTNFTAASLQRSFEITRADQGALIAGADSHALSVGDTTNVATTGGSGTGDVTFVVTSGSGNCSLSGTVLTATAAGTCVVTATKAADTRYAAATDDTATITVTTASPTVLVSGTTTVQSGTATTVTVTVSGLRAGYAPGSVTPILSGTTTGTSITPSSAALVLAGDGRSGTATFTVTAGRAGALLVGARVASTAAYAPVEAPAPAVLSVTPVPAALIPTVPTRLVDTRPGTPHLRPAPDRVLEAGEVLEVQFTDLDGLVPASGVSAVALDLGVVAPQGGGYVTAYPCGDRPNASSLNYAAGQTVSNAAVVPVSPSGSVCFSASQATHLFVDVDGWFATGNGFVAVAPGRLVDTRPNQPAIRPLTGAFAAGDAHEVAVTDIDGLVPASGVAAVSLNLTVVNPGGAGFVTAYACGDRPNASSINFTAGRTVANLAIVPVNPTNGSVCFYASQALHLVVDITGWFEIDHGFASAGPARVFDTRPGYSGLRAVASERVGGDTMLTVQVTDLLGLVPAYDVGAVALNVTAIDPAGGGYVTVWACGTRPNASSLNYAAHRTTAGAVIAPVDAATGTVCFYSSQPTHFAVDVNGWFIAQAGG